MPTLIVIFCYDDTSIKPSAKGSTVPFKDIDNSNIAFEAKGHEMNDITFAKFIEEYLDEFELDFRTIETSVGDTLIWFSLN